ncbi:hypothetical protein BT63DRAFT_428136 [Microthyrium microscopicum]|uniref:Calcineurin-like phosphoesterase domain-containing protein n=1 Tax=Microthyrium microscopicum TaxID=703497 RepID=A0A6A6U3Z5_9PEZI|nr:hypothetical protein BT63DRAFT_428136 [Microthyrium microscopicum]
MSVSAFLSRILLVLLPVVAISNLYIYFYPVWRNCSFARPARGNEPAPFRLLTFGDPQLEGDTSLPPKPVYIPLDFNRALTSLRERDPTALKSQIRNFITSTLAIPRYQVQYFRKHLDLIGNDYYLAHIYRTLYWYTKPTHVTVLGDLLGSQWIRDEEFERRSWRFWHRVFKGSSKVPLDRLTHEDGAAVHEEVLGADDNWSKWIFNVPGNHDIGYAGDIDEARVERFEREFGPVNGDIRFRLTESEEDSPTIRLIVLNTMNLDQPQLSEDLAHDTISFLNGAMGSAKDVGNSRETTILLTHIPLHKEAGVCADAPLFSYFKEEEGGGIREQNFLSYDSGRNAILQGLFGLHPSIDAPAQGLGRDGIILTGHDHEGCDVYHWIDRDTELWNAQRWGQANTTALVADVLQPGIREVTVRSMMGDFGGNAALVSAYWNDGGHKWQIDVKNCQFGVQHIWWAVHVLDIITVLLVMIVGVAYLAGVISGRLGSSVNSKSGDRKASGKAKQHSSSGHKSSKAQSKPSTARRKA